MLRRSIFLLLISLALFPSAQSGELAETDRSQIMQAVHRWEKAWADKDPVLAAQDYSDDADWTNAFGMRQIDNF